MKFMFRVRFSLAGETRVDGEADEIVLAEDEDVRVSIRARDGVSIEEADVLYLVGRGYPNETAASEDGRRWMAALTVGLMAELLPADFESRRPPGGGLTPAAFELMKRAATDHGLPVPQFYNDRPGIFVLPDLPNTFFWSDSARGRRHVNATQVSSEIAHAYRRRLETDERATLAFEYFSISNVISGADAKFVLLVMAIEALIEPGPRPDSQLAAIANLREHLATLRLDSVDRQVLSDALDRLRHEPRGRAGRQLVRSLGPLDYIDGKPVEFFVKCYTARSDLVHGNLPRPAVEFIRASIGPLRFLVRDLMLQRVGATARA